MKDREASWISPAGLKRKHYDFFMLNHFDEKFIKKLALKNLLIYCTESETTMILEESWDAFMEMYNYHRLFHTGAVKGKDIPNPVPDFLRKNEINYSLFRGKWFKFSELLCKEDDLQYYKIFSEHELRTYCRKNILVSGYCPIDEVVKIYYPSFLDLLELRNLNLDALRYNPKKCT